MLGRQAIGIEAGGGRDRLGIVGIARLKGQAGGAEAGDDDRQIGQGKGLVLARQAKLRQAHFAAIEAVGRPDHGVAGADGRWPQGAAGFGRAQDIGERGHVARQAIIADDAARAENGLTGQCYLRFPTGKNRAAWGQGDKFARRGAWAGAPVALPFSFAETVARGAG